MSHVNLSNSTVNTTTQPEEPSSLSTQQIQTNEIEQHSDEQSVSAQAIVEAKLVDKRNLYIRWQVSDDSLRAQFSKFGAISEARVVPGPRLRSFGFVTFEREEDAVAALNAMNGQVMHTEPLVIEHAANQPRPKRPPHPVKPSTSAGATVADGVDGLDGVENDSAHVKQLKDGHKRSPPQRVGSSLSSKSHSHRGRGAGAGAGAGAGGNNRTNNGNHGASKPFTQYRSPNPMRPPRSFNAGVSSSSLSMSTSGPAAQ